MEHLWAPWRIEYILSDKTGECVLCQNPSEDQDKENYILYRGEKNFVILNKYPYNPGHLMICPYRHTSSMEELNDEELLEHYQIVRRSITTLRRVFKPEGFNIGMNLGRTAGAGIDEHIHTHIVPRWNGDANFMPVIGKTRVLSYSIETIFEILLREFNK